MLLFDVTAQFDRACVDLIKKYRAHFPKADTEELLTFVRRHEKRNLALNNLCRQVQIQEQKRKLKVSKIRRDQVIEIAAAMFMDAVIKQRNEQLASSAEQQRLKDIKTLDQKAEDALEILDGAVEIEDSSTIGMN